MSVSEISFLSPAEKQMHADNGRRWLQYTVVNDPQELQVFENLQQMSVSQEELTTITANLPAREYCTRDVIVTTDFRIIYSYYEDRDHDEKQYVGNPSQIYPDYPINSDTTYQYMIDAAAAGFNLVYTKQFFTTLAGESDCVWIKEDGTEWAWRSQYDDPERLPLSKVNNIPLLPNAFGRPRTFNSCVTICVMPNNFSERFNFTGSVDDIYKIDVYELSAGETIQSKIFSDSTGLGLFHVAKGAVTVDGTAVELQQFYKQDPRVSATITATSPAFVLYMAKVPSI